MTPRRQRESCQTITAFKYCSNILHLLFWKLPLNIQYKKANVVLMKYSIVYVPFCASLGGFLSFKDKKSRNNYYADVLKVNVLHQLWLQLGSSIQNNWAVQPEVSVHPGAASSSSNPVSNCAAKNKTAMFWVLFSNAVSPSMWAQIALSNPTVTTY